MSELKPCPFCGSKNVYEKLLSILETIKCDDCGIALFTSQEVQNKGGLVDCWNIRAINSAASALGSKGGKSTSEKKRLASQRNGKLGGKRKKETDK
jgi:predicted nucleic-acid-binding Zn-ribbon protein